MVLVLEKLKTKIPLIQQTLLIILYLDNVSMKKKHEAKDKKNLRKKEKKFDDSPWGQIKRFWDYMWNDDSFGSYVVNFIFAFLVIKYIMFPVIGFAFNNDYPIVAIVTGSMEHKIVDGRVCDKIIVDVKNKNLNIDEYWSLCGNYYETNFNMNKEQFKEYDYTNGLNIGDVMILYGKNPQKIEVGEILVFIPQDKMVNGESYFFNNYGPVIHRIVNKYEDEQTGKIYFQTKGDHNPISQPRFETEIPEEDVIGVAVARIPKIGYVKLAFVYIVDIFLYIITGKWM